MVQKLVSTAVEESEEFFYVPKLYIGPDPAPTEPTEQLYVVGDAAITGDLTVANVFVPDGGTFGIAGNELLTFNAAGTAVFSGCTLGIGTWTEGTLHAHTASAGAVAAHADADEGVFENSSHGGISILCPDDAIGRIYFGGPTSNTRGGILYYGPTHGSVPDTFLFRIGGAYTGWWNSTGLKIGPAVAPAAKLHVDQSSTSAAIPVLILDQGDVSEEMIEFISTIGVGNAIEAVDGKTLTTTHFIKVTIPGPLTRYFPVGTIA